MAETRGITFHEDDTPNEFAAKLNKLVLWLTTDPKFDEIRVGDEAKWEHDGKATVTALKMATGAAADKVLTSDADGEATWQTVEAGQDPGGSTTQVQYNDDGSFAGHAKLTWNAAQERLYVQDIRAHDSDGMLIANEDASGYVVIADNGNVGVNCNPAAAYALDIGGSSRVTGDLAGGRALITAGLTGTGMTGDEYLVYHGVRMGSDHGVPLARDGKIVSIYAMAYITSVSGSVALDAEVRINGSDATDKARLVVSGTGWTTWGKTIARAEAAPFSAADFMALMIGKGGLGTVQYGNVLMAVGIQMDT